MAWLATLWMLLRLFSLLLLRLLSLLSLLSQLLLSYSLSYSPPLLPTHRPFSS